MSVDAVCGEGLPLTLSRARCVLILCRLLHTMQVWNTNQGGSGVVGIFNVQVSALLMHTLTIIW